jgi:parallel beta-helix repeat protein
MKKIFLCQLFIVVMLSLYLNTVAYARPIFVNDDANGNNNGSSWEHAYTDLQLAISQADGITYNQIWVADGIYIPGTSTNSSFNLKGNVAIYGGFSGIETDLNQRDWEKNITVLSGDIDRNDIVNPDGYVSDVTGEYASKIVGANAPYVIKSSYDNESTILDGFFITEAKACKVIFLSHYFGCVIFLYHSDAHLNNLMIVGNSGGSLGGGVLCDNSNPHFNNVTIAGNSAIFGAGIYCKNANPTLSNVTIYGNSASDSGGGIIIDSTSHPIFSSENKCSIFDNKAKVGNDIYTSNGNKISIILHSFSVLHPTSLYACPIDRFIFDIQEGQHTQISSDLYVSPAGDNRNNGTSQDAPLQSINYALSIIQADANNPRTIYLDEGFFSPETGNSFPIKTVSYVALQGLGMDKTILDANHTNGVIFNYNTQAVCIKQLKITHGASDYGAGIYCNKSSPVLSNLLISENTSSQSGGGVYCSGSSPVLTNSIIAGNSASINGGGIDCRVDSSPTFNNVTISGNKAKLSGAGIYIENSSPVLRNVTISGNLLLSEYRGGAIYSDKDSNPQIFNSIIWNNKTSDIFNQIHTETSSSIIMATHCMIQGGYTGTNNLDLDPQFITPVNPDSAPYAGGNLRLQYGSPAMNAGLNEYISQDYADLDEDGNTLEQIPYDLDGKKRISIQTVDMGAYEVQSKIPTITPILAHEIYEDNSISGIHFTIDDMETPSSELTITISSSDITKVTNENITISGMDADRSLSIKPTSNEYGQLSITINVEDDDHMKTSSTFSLSILPVNDPPTMTDKTGYLDEDMYLNLSLNATDIERDNLTYRIVTSPSNGAAEIIEDMLLYRPAPNFNGVDRFYVKANDGNADSNIVDIALTIYPIPDPPIAHPQSLFTHENTSIPVVLSASDPDGDSLTFTITQMPQHGTLSGSPPNLIYEPDQWFYKTDQFVFSANDGMFDSNAAIVNIEVKRSEKYNLTLFGNTFCQILVNDIAVLPPWESQFNADQQVCFEAISNENFRFTQWTGDDDRSENSICITIDKDKTLTANFTKKIFLLTIQGSKTILINDHQYDLPVSKPFEIHTKVLLTSDLKQFYCWEGDIQTCTNPLEITMNDNITITPIFYPIPLWETSLIVERAVDTSDAQYTNTISIGTASQAYTKKSKELAAYYSCDIKLSDTNQILVSADIQEDMDHKNIYIWNLAVNPRGNIGNELLETTATISWNPQTLNAKGTYELRNDFDGTGETIIADMRSITSYQITDYSYKKISIVWQKAHTYTFQLNQGWNLISLPMIPEKTNVNDIFPGSLSAFEFKNGSYYPVSHLEAGKGYWIKVPEQAEYSLTGQHLSNYSKLLSKGWHLLGAVNHECFPATEPGDNILAIYQYVNGAYQLVTSLEPGNGYWVNVKQDCVIVIGDPISKKIL